MHELSLCASILRILEEQAAAQGYRRVRTVWLEVGPFAGVEEEALRFGFEVSTRGTLAAGARLEIVTLQAQGVCLDCGRRMAVREHHAACPACGGAVLAEGGRELRIRELEVE